MADVLADRRAGSGNRLDAVRARVPQWLDLEGGCVYVTGSFARGEASEFSDLDLFIVSAHEAPRLSELDAICLKADLIRATKELGFPPFSGDGVYLQMHRVSELVESLGSSTDDASNTFTARMLLLLESRALLGEDVYRDAIERVITKYWRDFADHSEAFMPAFLANDILRLWRTFCVNYEARTQSEPEEKKVKRKIKNYKLKHSRLLTCYSALAYLLHVYVKDGTVHPRSVTEMVRLSPTERIESVGSESTAARASADAVLATYEDFLSNSAASEDALIEIFRDRARARELMKGATKLGEGMFDLLAAVGNGNPFYRLLVV